MASIRKHRGTRKTRWTVDYRDAGGRRHRLTATSQAEAEDLLADKIRESRQPGAFSSDREITLRDYADRWLRVVAHEIKPRYAVTHSSCSPGEIRFDSFGSGLWPKKLSLRYEARDGLLYRLEPDADGGVQIAVTPIERVR